MFKKLQIKFVAIVMSSVAIVLAIVFAGICISEYQRSASNVNQALTSSIERAVEASQRLDDPFALFDMVHDHSKAILSEQIEALEGGSEAEGSSTETDARNSSEPNGETADGNEAASGNEPSDRTGKNGAPPDDGNFAGPRIGGRNGEARNMVPVAVYTLTSESTFAIAQGFATASIDSDVLNAAATRMSALEDGSGTLADLRLHYLKRTVSETTYVAFADTSTTDSWKSLALTLAIAGLGTLAVFFVIALLLSRWALRPVREAWDSQRQFVADASHDLKTPLTVILANASILLKHPDHTIASESQWIESTQIEAENMQGLVNEMLELAQVESTQELATVPHEPLDFSDLVDGETLLFDSVALERGCLFECEIDEGVQVAGDAQQLHKMVSTLVENAFKYVDEGGSINIALRRVGKNVQLSVRNSGSTISEEDLPHIFDRFYRTDKARTSGAGGFGLGLAIAREIARSHGGDITCASSEAAGTTFSVTLPAL